MITGAKKFDFDTSAPPTSNAQDGKAANAQKDLIARTRNYLSEIAKEILGVFRFPVHQHDLILGGQVREPFKAMFDHGFHSDCILQVGAASLGRNVLFTVGNDNQLKVWRYLT